MEDRNGRDGRGWSEGRKEREDGEGGRVHGEKAGEEERNADRGDVRVIFGEPGVGDDGEGQEQHDSFRALETHLRWARRAGGRGCARCVRCV